jgi:adenylate kinase
VRLVLLGPPGVGKGTQAAMLASRFGACHLSTGDVFRAARTCESCARTPALDEAFRFMSAGRLVPDTTVIALVAERSTCLRCGGGFLLDGFPRTVAQAEALERLLATHAAALDAVVAFDLSLEAIVARISGRRTCPGCRAVYHVEGHPPRVHGVCDGCGAGLEGRDDDRPEAVRVRMEAYERSTAPLLAFYRDRGLLVTVPADGTPEQVFARTVQALEAAVAAPAVGSEHAQSGGTKDGGSRV